MTNQFKAGDKVKVVRRVEVEKYWSNVWVEEMNDYIGRTYTVESQTEAGVIFVEDEDEYWFPPFSLELVEDTPAEPKKVPRKHAEMIKQWADDDSLEVEVGSEDKGWMSCSSPWWCDDSQYRFKPKPKVKRWKWVLQKPDGGYWVTGDEYTEEEIQNFLCKVIQKVEGTEIEV